MRAFILVLLVAGLAVSLTPATPAPKNVKQPVLYFPTKVGTKWVYDTGDSEVTLVITKVEENDGAMLVSVGKVGKDGKVVASEQVEVSKNGQRLASQRGLEETILKLPLNVAEESTYDHWGDGGKFVVELVHVTAFLEFLFGLAEGRNPVVAEPLQESRFRNARELRSRPRRKPTHFVELDGGQHSYLVGRAIGWNIQDGEAPIRNGDGQVEHEKPRESPPDLEVPGDFVANGCRINRLS